MLDGLTVLWPQRPRVVKCVQSFRPPPGPGPPSPVPSRPGTYIIDHTPWEVACRQELSHPRWLSCSFAIRTTYYRAGTKSWLGYRDPIGSVLCPCLLEWLHSSFVNWLVGTVVYFHPESFTNDGWEPKASTEIFLAHSVC